MQKCCEGGVVGIWCNHDHCTGAENVTEAVVRDSALFYAPSDEQQKLRDERMDTIARNGNTGEHYGDT